jgi:2-polyprenyl-3-methyl-5-hydroxy-6-metoxy-1,4-benzoquinol methylase
MNERAVQSFWNLHPCGDHIVGGLHESFADDYEKFFTAYDNWRYRQESHIPACLDEIDWRGKKVLEIGLGQGAESEQIIRRGAHWSGLDLTWESIDRVRVRLETRALPHDDLKQGSALAIPWPNNTFDLVFSHGVLHHIPDIRAAQDEIHRVLKPSGILVAMLYARASLNYQLSIKILRRAALAAAYPLRHSALLRPSPLLRQHLDNAEREGLLRYLVIDTFTHHNTDGPHNPYARVYSPREVIREFPSFDLIRCYSRYMHAPPLPVRRLPAQRWLGWHLWVHLQPRPLPDTDTGRRVPAVAQAQETTYGEGADYVAGSPHLSHPRLHARLARRIRCLVDAGFARSGRCRILEVGAGHGTFTEHLASLGAEVTVTEISKPSVDVLARRFQHCPNVRVVHDPDGSGIFGLSADFDLVLCISVLHHIPDYAGFVQRLTPLLQPGGALATYQDPDWYPRRRPLDNAADRGAYFAWRVTRGELLAGARTRIRRLQDRYNEAMAADMTEYHVVRQGVDDQALAGLLRADFGQVELFRYWSTQAAPWQWLGDQLRLRNTFGIEATDRRAKGPEAR